MNLVGYADKMADMKMNKISILLLSLFLLIASSCAKKGGRESNLEFTLGAYFDAAGGAMLWGENPQTGETFARNVSIAGHSEFLSYGPWKFWVVAWASDDANNQLTGLTSCDFQAVNVDNTSTDNLSIVFNLTNAKCIGSEFSPNTVAFSANGATKNFVMFPNVDIKNCRNLTDSLGYADTCPVNIESGYFSSYRVLLVEHNDFVPTGNVLKSACVETDAASADGKSLFSVPANIPLGGVGPSKAPMMTVVRGFYGSIDCDQANDGTKGLKGPALGFDEEVYPRGLINGSSSAIPRSKLEVGTASYCPVNYSQSNNAAACQGALNICEGANNDGRFSTNCAALAAGTTALTSDTNVYTTGAKYALVVESNGTTVCRAGREFATFASGRGDFSRPFTICEPDQFNNIDNDAVYVTQSFEVLRDLDFHNYGQNNCTAFGMGLNFNPVGGGYDAGCVPTAVVNFTGTFNGNNFKFIGPRFRDGSMSSVGLFRSLSTSAQVRNLHIDYGEIGGMDQVGMVAGNCIAGMIDNISMQGIEIDAQDNAGVTYAGSLVGLNQGCTLSSIFVYDSRVEGRGNFVGGIAGETMGNITIAEFIDGNVSARGDNGVPAEYVGGLAGWVSSGAVVDQVAIEATVYGSDRVGGLTGQLSGTSTIQNAYFKGYVSSDRFLDDSNTVDYSYTAGLVGNLNSSTLQFAYFLGDVEHQCAKTTPANCRVGKIYGYNLAGTISGVYSQTEMPQFNMGGGPGATLSEIQFRTSPHSTNFPSFNFTTIWDSDIDDFPRFLWQTGNACDVANNRLSVALQISSLSRGSALNPIRICNLAQLKEIKSNLNLEYELRDNVSIWGWLDTDMPSNFNGMFDGNDRMLLGGSISSASPNYGFFQSLTAAGEIEDLKLLGFESQNLGRDQVGALVGTNNGLIQRVLVEGFSGGIQDVGLIAGVNFGTIEASYAFGRVEGGGNAAGQGVGGIAGRNSTLGVIDQVVSGVEINPTSATSINAGGVVGYNQGMIREASSRSRVNNKGANLFLDLIGGIAGVNLGTIIDSSFSEQSEIRSQSSTANIGGIAGANVVGGVISRSVSFGRIIHDFVASPPASYNAIAGSNPGTVNTSVYYVNEPFAPYFPNAFTADATACAGTGPTYTFSTTAAIPTGPYTNIILFVDNDFNRSVAASGASGGGPYIVTINSPSYDPCPDINAAVELRLMEVKGTASMAGNKRTPAQASDIDNYCAGASLGDQFFVCSSGFDIAEEFQGVDGVGTERLFDYYISSMFNLPQLYTEPVWVIKPGGAIDERPRLLIEH